MATSASLRAHERDLPERQARRPAAVAAGRERQPVLLARHPPVGRAAHLQQPEQHLRHLQVRLPEDEAAPDQVDGRPPQRAVRRQLRRGRAEDQEHEGLRGDALEVVVEGGGGGLAVRVLLRLEVEEGADHAEQDDGRGLRSKNVFILRNHLFSDLI